MATITLVSALGTAIAASYQNQALGRSPEGSLVVQNYTGGTLLVGPSLSTIQSGLPIPPYSYITLPWSEQAFACKFATAYNPVAADNLLVQWTDSPLPASAANLYNPIVQNTLLYPISFGPNGGFYQGSSGTFASPNTGLKMYQDANGNGRIELWSGGVLIWSWDAVGGLVNDVVNGAFATTNRSINWLTGSTTIAQINVAATPINLLQALLSVGPLTGDDSELREIVTAPTNFNAEILLKATSDTTVAQIDLNASSANGASATYTADKHIFAGHLQTSGTAPSVSPNSSAGVGATASMDTGSTDTAGRIILNTGTGTSAGQIATMTYAAPYLNRPFVVVAHSGGNATGIGALSTAFSTASLLELFIGVALNPSTQYTIDYHVIGH